MYRPSIALVIAAAALSCGESTPPALEQIASGRIRLQGDVAFEAEGAPVFSGRAILPATFAVAVADSVAGAWILAFNDEGAGKGDFFVLRIEELRTGPVGPCGNGPSYPGPDGSTFTEAGPCGGHLHQDLDATSDQMTFSSHGFLRILDGSVRVTDIGARFTGTVSNLKLEGLRADTVGRTPIVTPQTLMITSGEFDLPLVTGDAARYLSYCFLEFVGRRSCTY